MPRNGDGPVFNLWVINGDDKSAGSQAAIDEEGQEQCPSVGRLSTEARSVYPCVHHHAEKAEFGHAQSGPCPADERLRGHQLYWG